MNKKIFKNTEKAWKKIWENNRTNRSGAKKRKVTKVLVHHLFVPGLFRG
jgi:hypothetical protein